jgi:serralysin
MQFGWQEGRDPSARFDTLGYLAANPDVAAGGANPLAHYMQFGIYEGRQAVNDAMWG